MEDYINLVWNEAVRRREFCDKGLISLRFRARAVLFAIGSVFTWAFVNTRELRNLEAERLEWQTIAILIYCVFGLTLVALRFYAIERPLSIEGTLALFTEIYARIELNRTLTKEVMGNAILDIRESTETYEKHLDNLHSIYNEMFLICCTLTVFIFVVVLVFVPLI